jgi:hypothetical protein
MAGYYPSRSTNVYVTVDDDSCRNKIHKINFDDQQVLLVVVVGIVCRCVEGGPCPIATI